MADVMTPSTTPASATPIAVLGHGQLGWMLLRAGERLGIPVTLLDPEQPSLPPPDSLITVEREHWPDTAANQQLQSHPGWQNSRALECLVNRRRQKAMFDSLNLATAPWCIPDQSMNIEILRETLGAGFFLKSAEGGYDGRGQWRDRAEQSLPEWYTHAIAETAMGFDTEVSLVGARGREGRCVFYPLTENYHHRGVLKASIAGHELDQSWQVQAEAMLASLMSELDYVGVMAMECFVMGDQLYINEVAPRVHNSGHWTLDGASISQFELHLRALLDWPMPPPEQEGVSVMLNLLGLHHDPEWLQTPGAHLYWYNKTHRAARKMGHVNFHHTNTRILAERISQFSLPANYTGTKEWLLERLARSQEQAQPE
ncbi:MAG: ATP-grasp domain-containing protein [Porticoccaceae bacterium]